MHIAIDLTGLQPRQTGVDVYLVNLVEALAQVDDQNRYTVFVNAGDRRMFAGKLKPGSRVLPLCLRPRPARFLFQQLLLPLAVALLKVDVLHSPSFLMPFWKGQAKHVVTVHDLTPLLRPDLCGPLHRSKLFRSWVRMSIRRADSLIVPSAAVRGELHEAVPGVLRERVHIIPWGIGAGFEPRSTREVRGALARLGLQTPYLLHVGTIQPRKNLLGLIDAFRRLVVDRRIREDLVLVGCNSWDADRIIAAAGTDELRGRVHFAGYVSSEDLACLYSGATVMCYPSFDEGFGFPPLEALACGTAVVASDIPALKEKLHKVALLVDPRDPREIADAIDRVLRDDELRQSMEAEGPRHAGRFHWEETAGRTMDCYRGLESAP